MAKVNFRTSDFARAVAAEGSITQKNRFFESNPFLSDDGAALIARPGLTKLANIGAGPIRGLASEAGSFNGDLFVVSGGNLYRMDNQLNQTLITTGLYSPEKGFVNMAITAQLGTTPEYCFIADGRTLFVYIANGFATNQLTGTAANNDVVVIGTTYYKFTNAGVNVGTPAGTSANPWLVNLDVSNLNALTNLGNAINASGIAGTDYSTALTKHTTVKYTNVSSTQLSVASTLTGALGNSTATTETGAALSWTLGATLTGGGAASIRQVDMPDGVGAIDVAVCNSFVVVVPVQATGKIGRFYWINPGETTVNALNFATAERSPDGISGVQVSGDLFWTPGATTTQVFYFTGDATAPVARMQGVVFDRGSWQNTAKVIHETLMVVDADGGVFALKGGSPQRVSTPDIEEEIRKAISAQSTYLY